jgi:O-antigen ligase
MNIQLLNQQGVQNQSFWQKYFWPLGVPLLLSFGLSLLVAYFIAVGLWPLSVGLVFLIPMAILLNRYPLVALIVWLVILPFFPPVGANRFLYWVIHLSLIPLALGVNIISRMFRLQHHPPVKLTLADVSIIIYIVLVSFSILYHHGPDYAYFLNFANRTVVGFMAYWFIRFLNPSERDLGLLTWLMLILVIAEGVIGLISWFAPALLPRVWITEGLLGDRVTGSFSEPGAYSTALIFWMIFVFQYAMTKANKSNRLFFIAVFSFGLICVFFTFTRSSWLAMLLVLLVLLYLYPKTVLLMLAFSIPLISLSAGLLANEFAHAMSRLNTTETIDNRRALAHAGNQMFFAKPFFGWGYGNYDRYDWQFMERVDEISPTAWDIRYGTSHNTYVTLLAETGAVTFLFYIFPVLYWGWRSLKLLFHIPKKDSGFANQKWLILMWACIASYAVTAQAIDFRAFWYSQATVWIVLGFIAVLITNNTPARYPEDF